MRKTIRATCVAVIFGLAAACTAAPASSPTTEATPIPSIATSTPDATPAPPVARCTPDPAASADAGEASPAPSPAETPLSPGPLEPGRYTTTHFQPRLALTLGAGWTETFEDDADEIAFDRSGGFLGIGRIACVVDPRTGRAMDAPSDLAAWLSQHDALGVDHTEEVTIAGLPGTMVEGFAARTVELFYYPTGSLRAVADNRHRWYVLPLEGPDLAITVAAEPAGFDAVMTEVQPILDSIEVFGASPSSDAIPPGTYTADIPPGGEAAPGLWTMEVAPNGITWTNPGTGAVFSPGDVVEMTSTGIVFAPDPGCPDQDGEPTEGRYQWSWDGDELTFTLVSDSCAGRRDTVTAAPWALTP